MSFISFMTVILIYCKRKSIDDKIPEKLPDISEASSTAESDSPINTEKKLGKKKFV